jgi:hypothetical protein
MMAARSSRREEAPNIPTRACLLNPSALNGAFSVSPIHVWSVREYIRQQPEHHRQEDFQTEYRRFCEKNGRPLDERYAWD